MTTAAIELVGVSKVYPGLAPVIALDDVSVAVSPGEFVAIMGPSGSGKSTLLNILGLLDRPSVGSVLVGGADASAMSERERTSLRGRAIGFVFQSFELLAHRSVLDNVMMAGLYGGVPQAQRRQGALRALSDVGLGGRGGSMPAELSGGERQRVAIARALAGDAALLLCDEPTGNLDTKNAAHIGSLLVALNERGSTIVLITHDPEVAALGGRTVRLRDGRVDP